MNPVKWLLICLPSTLPAAFAVMMFDSLSKEPYGWGLYIAVVLGSLLLTLFFERNLGDRNKSSDQPLGRFGLAVIASLVVGGAVVAWLIASGH